MKHSVSKFEIREQVRNSQGAMRHATNKTAQAVRFYGDSFSPIG